MRIIMWIAAIGADFFKVSVLLFVVGALIMAFVTSIKKLFTKNKKKFLIYAVVLLLLFAATALLSNDKVLNDLPLSSFIGFQIVFLLLGILHIYVLRKFFSDLSEKPTNFWGEFLYTIASTCIGLTTFMMVVEIYKPSYKYIFAASVLLFIIPFMVLKLYEFAISIPLPVFKKWYYPINENIKDPKEDEMQNPLVISFEFNKGHQEDEYSNFRLKAPENMEFGRLFYFFMNDYNDRHPESLIQFMDKSNNPYGWLFYKKPKWYGTLKHIDFSRTVYGNKIKEDDIIICKKLSD